MPFGRMRAALKLTMLAILLPVLAACGGGAQPTTDTTLPTAAVATPSSGGATSAPAPTVPMPTSALAQPTATTGDVAAAPTTEVEELTFPLRTEDLQFGIVNHLYYTDRERVLTLNSIAGFTWVRQQVVWKDIEGPNPGDYAWGELDNIVADVAAKNQKLLVSIVRSPSFYNPTGGMPEDPTTLGRFAEAMAQRYGDKISAYEIWNEPNLAVENGGRVTPEDAGRYVELLADCYTRIKAINPRTFVIAAPPSSSGVNDPAIAVSDENYYRAMYSYKNGMIKDYFDAQGVHPGGSANPPDTLWPDNPSNASGWVNDPTFYFRHIENVRRFMVEEGVGDHQMWITEYGWATPNDTPGYEFGNEITFEEQAEYIVGAMRLVNDEYRDDQGRPWVGAMFLWNMNYAIKNAADGEPNHEQGSFGILNTDWSPRPSFLAIQSFLAQVKAERGS